MFCTKCGYNAGTAKFCPKCGNPLNPQPVQETPVQNEPVAQTVQSEPVAQQQFGTQPQFNETVQPQFGTQPQSGTVPPVNADVPRYQHSTVRHSSTSECRCTKISAGTSYAATA